MKLKDVPYLVWSSFRKIVWDEPVEILGMLKRAKTWSYIVYATVFVALYYQNYTVIKVALPLMILLYVVRRRYDPDFNLALKRRAFFKNAKSEIMEYYEKYKKQCFFSKTIPLEYEDWKREERKKLQL